MKNDYSEIMIPFPENDMLQWFDCNPKECKSFTHTMRFSELVVGDKFTYNNIAMIKTTLTQAKTDRKHWVETWMFNSGDLVKVKKDVVESESNLKDVSPSNTNPMPFIDKELLFPTSNSTEQKDVTKLLLYIKDNILTVNFDLVNDNFIQYIITIADDWVEVLPPLLISGQLVSDLFIQQKDGVFGVYRYNFNHNHNVLVEKSMSGDNWRQGDTVTIIFNSFISF